MLDPTYGFATSDSKHHYAGTRVAGVQAKGPLWDQSEYDDLANAIETSLPIENFALEHNRTMAEVSSVLQTAVLNPLYTFNLAQLPAPNQDYGTPVQTWAQHFSC